MNDHVKKLLQSITEYCRKYIEKKISIDDLRCQTEAIYSNFEGDVPKQLRNTIYNFTVDLESIEFMETEENHYNLALDKIKEINKIISEFTH